MGKPRIAAFAIAAAALTGGPAHAGMPALYKLGDAAALRLETFSFFAFILLICALIFQILWNYLQRDFPRLPRLGYARALCFILVLGLAFNLVLAMIAGARELMTPGAWERHGVSYRLKADGAAHGNSPGARERDK